MYVTKIAARYISHEMIGKRINKEFEDEYSYDGTVISLDLESGTRTHVKVYLVCPNEISDPGLSITTTETGCGGGGGISSDSE